MLAIRPETVPGYQLRQRLGTGGFAEVWDAIGPDGKVVALKFIDTRGKPAALLRGEIRVLRAVSQLNHPNLIKMGDVLARGHFLVVSMERADGNLDELRQAYLEETGQHIPADHLLELLEQTANALDHLAAMRLPGFNLSSPGMQHCDVKPSNLLLLGETVKVADFGLCAAEGQHTHRDSWRGTWPYAAPELYHGRATHTTDQYALAVCWCDLGGGPRMFRDPKTQNGPFMPIDLMRARMQEAPVLARALHDDPTRRYPNCRAFIAALREVARLSNNGTKQSPKEVLAQSRSRKVPVVKAANLPSNYPTSASSRVRP
jgi:serine/threonine protein kinase